MKVTLNDNISIVVHSDHSINTYAVISLHNIAFYVDNHIQPASDTVVIESSSKQLEDFSIKDLKVVHEKLSALELEHSKTPIKGRDY